ncbi:MAG: ISKra4 family transposase, partial [Vulcanimicrobiaceae bacterium]
YLQTKWASLMSYGMTVGLLKDVVPVSEDLSVRAVRKDVEHAGQRLDGELGDEQVTFVEGTPVDWQQRPDPAGPLIVGIDGGYVHARNQKRGEGWFEVIVGKSIPAAGDSKCFGFVSRLDAKPKRRLYDMLASQGLQMNQQLVFLSDGGDTVRELQMRMSPQAEHILDWFHVTMRLTLMRQLALGLTNAVRAAQPARPPEQSETDDETVTGSELIADITSLKWNLWHGNVRRALEGVDDLSCEVKSIPFESENKPKLARMLREFGGYINANRAFIPNYGDRWRNDEVISTAFAESAVNQIVSQRFVKKQQMRWTERGSHHLLQIRTRVLNNEWRATMARWNPGMIAAA